MKYRFLILFVLNFTCINMHAQSMANCYNFDEWNNRGKEYAPLFIPNENYSILNVHINLIFIQKDDGTGNFQENDNEEQRLLDDVITILNDKMAELKMPDSNCFIGTEADLIRNTRIRFVDHRYYIPKSSVWDNGLHVNNYYRLHPDIHPWYLDNVDDSLNNTLPDSLKGINIYFTEDSVIYHRYWEIHNALDTADYWTGDSKKGCSEPPDFQNLYASSRIHIPCRYSRYWWMKHIVPQLVSEGNPQWYYEGWLTFAGGLAGDLAHELGHSFNLLHPTDDFILSYPSYPQRDCIASIMNPHASISSRDFLPPQEIGLMYFTSMTTNVQQFIPSNTYLGTKTLNTTVSLPRMRMFYSLLIGSSGNVTMPCDITFSPQGYIKVQSGGVLTVNGASLQSIQDSWGGIIVQSGGQLLLSDVSIGDYNIIVKSGGCLVITNDLTITGDHSIIIEDGGYLCVNADAFVDLVDNFSLIVVSPNAFLGCPSCSNNCVLSRTSLSNSGNGSFVLYSGTSYIQNTIITSDSLATGSVVYAGYDVTNNIPYGNVVVENGGDLRIKANETTLTTGVEIKLGGTLTIEK